MGLSNAERQARFRAKRAEQQHAPTIRFRRPADRRSRPQRWRDAVNELVALQSEYAEWRDSLPAGLEASATAEALTAVTEFDLSELEAIEPPRGYGRDG